MQFLWDSEQDPDSPHGGSMDTGKCFREVYEIDCEG